MATPHPLVQSPLAADADQLAVNTLRTLAIDAVERAGSGHPGAPMALAPVAYALWQRVLHYDPADPSWPRRDRFVLSIGHASMLLYGLLHLAGVRRLGHDGRPTGEFAVRMEDLQRFRQLGSRAPGHPERGFTAGVETTTGPLGQGVGASVGMAIAARWLAARYDRPGLALFGHRVWALCGDGDLMEGVSNEAASLAGHLGLGNLCWIFDDNHVTLDGPANASTSEDVGARFGALGWNVLRVVDANDLDELTRALKRAEASADRPTLVALRSHIGYGGPTKQDSHEAHGEPLGTEEARGTKRNYGWPEEAQFLVPEGVREAFRDGLAARGSELHEAWSRAFAEYRKLYPVEADELDRIWRAELPHGWDRELPTFPADSKGVATRVAGGKAIEAIGRRVPWLVGGAADLAGSTRTRLSFEGAGEFSALSPGGRNIRFGVREHAMTAAANGLALAGLRPFASTFLVFSDYLKPALRLSAVQELPVLLVLTHDSVALGEDGPTHQPVEHLAALRAVPGLVVLRPADANETVEAFRTAMTLGRPAAIVLTRQAVPTFDRSRMGSAQGVARGAYVLVDAESGPPEVLLLATGSEVQFAVAAHERLAKEDVRARVVSMPSSELFASQSREYRDSVLPPAITARVAVEAAATFGWERWVGLNGGVIGVNRFGLSAPGKVVLEELGITADAVVEAARAQLMREGGGHAERDS